MHLVGFIIRIYHDSRSPKRQNPEYSKSKNYVSVYFCVQQLYCPFLDGPLLFLFHSFAFIGYCCMEKTKGSK